MVPLGCCCEKRDGSFFGALPRTPSTLSCSLQERWSPRRAPRGNLFTLRSVCFRGVGETCPAGNHHNYFRTSNSHRALSFSLGRRAKISEGVTTNLLPSQFHMYHTSPGRAFLSGRYLSVPLFRICLQSLFDGRETSRGPAFALMPENHEKFVIDDEQPSI